MTTTALGPMPATHDEGETRPGGPAPDRLIEVVRSFAASGYAVIDGGLFPNLPGRLRAEHLFARSLFLDHADVEIEKAGPWLVPLAQAPGAADRVLGLVGAKPAAVFWCSTAEEATLYRHLRTLNMVQIPDWAAAGGSELPPDRDPSSREAHETVLFRHWDPRVLGGLLPVLDASQFRRLLGPAAEVAFWTDEYGGLKRVPADRVWPTAPRGMLVIRSEQVLALGERRMIASRRRIESYIRDVAKDEVAALDEGELAAILTRSESTGRELGLRSEQGYGRWAYVMVRTRGRALEQSGLRAYLTDGIVHPDEKVSLLLKTMSVLALRAGHG